MEVYRITREASVYFYLLNRRVVAGLRIGSDLQNNKRQPHFWGGWYLSDGKAEIDVPISGVEW
jgi:hypothetical protein